MEREQLFQNLSELERQLRGIKSATDRVNQVIAADKELVAAVNAFTAEARKVLDASRSVYDGEVREIKDAAIKSLDKSAVDFSAKVISITSELTTNVKMLRQTVDTSIKPMVDETVGVIEKSLKPFVKDEMPKTFNGFMDKYEVIFKKASDDISTASELFAEQAVSNVEELKKTVLAIKAPHEQFKSLLENIKKATDASNELIRKDVEVSKKAGEDTVNAAKKIDEIAKTISSSIADVKESISSNAKDVMGYIKNVDAETRSALLEKMTHLQDIPELLEVMQSLMDSSFHSLDTSISHIVFTVDMIAGDTRGIKNIDTRFKNTSDKVMKIAEDVDANKTSIEMMQKENKTMKLLLILSVIFNVCIGIGVMILLSAKL